MIPGATTTVVKFCFFSSQNKQAIIQTGVQHHFRLSFKQLSSLCVSLPACVRVGAAIGTVRATLGGM